MLNPRRPGVSDRRLGSSLALQSWMLLLSNQAALASKVVASKRTPESGAALRRWLLPTPKMGPLALGLE